jgi:AraC-like DNA-binding protein/mannose-6-phosphate isomerase-like protein (cupin superfamily)
MLEAVLHSPQVLYNDDGSVKGTFFSYRLEEPHLALHLKVVPWVEQYAGGVHAHDFIELVQVLNGTAVHTHGRRRYPVYPGDCFVIGPGEWHGFETRGDLKVNNVIFYPELLQKHEAELQDLPGFSAFFSLEPLFRDETSFRHKLHLTMAQRRAVSRYCDGILQETTSRGPGYVTMAEALFVQLAVCISRNFSESLDTEAVRAEFDRKGHVIAEAISYLEQNYTGDVRLEQVARSTYISPSRLQHVFKEVTGTSLFDYLARMRIDRACELLRGTNRTLSDIAFSLGYHDPSYFGRQFKKLTGTTPSSYRGGGR